MHLSVDNTFHSSGEVLQKCGILVQTEKSAESSDGDCACHMFSPEKTVGHLRSNFITPR